MDWDKVRAELEELSKAQLRILIELAFGWLPLDRQDLLVKLVGQMKRVNKGDKKEGVSYDSWGGKGMRVVAKERC